MIAAGIVTSTVEQASPLLFIKAIDSAKNTYFAKAIVQIYVWSSVEPWSAGRL